MTDDTLAEDFGRADLGSKKIGRDLEIRDWDGQLITEPGAYRGVPIERYHGDEICATHSVSSTGLKVLVNDKGARSKGQTPRHYWEGSSLNPRRKVRETTDALRLGQAFHDALLLPELWRSNYHRLPEGFSRAAKVKMAAEIAEADAAIAAGMSCVSLDEVDRVECMAEAMLDNDLIKALLGDGGEAEITLVWQDSETGVWLRARPDWMRNDRLVAMNMKTDADASFAGFSKSIAKYGYAQSAALELEGYLALTGIEPGTFVHPVVEKPGAGWQPGDYIATAVWILPPEDIERGKWLNRIALRTLRDCLAANVWPGYTPQPEPCGLPHWARYAIDNGGAGNEPDDEINA